MHVILTTDVPDLGIAGQVVRVKDGYARNYLMPRGLALLATEGRVRDMEHKKRIIVERQRKEVAGHEEVSRRLSKVALSFTVLAGAEGKLFGSVTNSDIHQQLVAQGFELDRRKVILPDPIKATGTYEVPIRLHREVTTKIKVEVVAQVVAPSPDDVDEDAEEESDEEADEREE